MNWISFIICMVVCAVCYFIALSIVGRKVTKLQREKFDLNWQQKDLKNKYNEMENALILISEGDLLKREMVAVAQKVLDECEKMPAE